jgi:hypothetical protein
LDDSCHYCHPYEAVAFADRRKNGSCAERCNRVGGRLLFIGDFTGQRGDQHSFLQGQSAGQPSILVQHCDHQRIDQTWRSGLGHRIGGWPFLVDDADFQSQRCWYRPALPEGLGRIERRGGQSNGPRGAERCDGTLYDELHATLTLAIDVIRSGASLD